MTRIWSRRKSRKSLICRIWRNTSSQVCTDRVQKYSWADLEQMKCSEAMLGTPQHTNGLWKICRMKYHLTLIDSGYDIHVALIYLMCYRPETLVEMIEQLVQTVKSVVILSLIKESWPLRVEFQSITYVTSLFQEEWVKSVFYVKFLRQWDWVWFSILKKEPYNLEQK